MVQRVVDDVLEHHGIKGMKWGVRRKNPSGHSSSEESTPSHDAARAHEYSTRAKSGGTKTLSNQELQHLVNRMDLEQRYNKLSDKKSPILQKGAKVAGQMAGNVLKTQVQVAAGAYVAKALAQAMKARA